MSLYVSINVASGNLGNPEPAICSPQRWEEPGGFSFGSGAFHPGASFQMRSEITSNNHGHQATYAFNGAAIRGGVAAGSADRSPPGGSGHVNLDVLPFNIGGSARWQSC